MDTLKNKNFFKKNCNQNTVFDTILDYIDLEIANLLRKIPYTHKQETEEIRLRLNKPLMIVANGYDYFVSYNGNLTTEDIDSYIIKENNIINTFTILSNYSIYAFEQDLRNGFITIKGGHRVGIAGKAVYGPNGIESIKDISSLNIRIAKQKIGVANKVIKYIIKPQNTIYHTLIVSPPQCGKTTLLRDLIRCISNGISEYNFKGLKVGVVDERSEIAGSYKGYPQNDVGIRTDVLDGFLKYDGIIQLIRAMSPAVIATDELGDKKDVKAIHEALKAGVKIISTVHGENIKDLLTKPNLKEIIKEKIFERIILLDNSRGVGTVKDIIEGTSFNSILKK